MAYKFTLEHVCKQSGARAGRIETTHGVIETPIFMPVGTQAAIKGGVQPRDLRDMNAQIILSNTYHLMLRPGSERIRDAGGLHKFMAWDRPILTDSGGFQVFSLSHKRKITDEGVVFRSHVDGSLHTLNAEEAIRLQENFGSDIAMAFDECPPAQADAETISRAMARTTAWLDRAIAARQRQDEVALYGIVQGGIRKELRTRHVEEICSRDGCEGFAIGGLSVGETITQMHDVCGHTASQMPQDKARYLMGVGTPLDLLVCIGHGIDQFDCVMPSRNGRHGKVFTHDGPLYIKNRFNYWDDRPLDPSCSCTVCQQFSRSYIRHLWTADEALGKQLIVMHNLAFYLQLTQGARQAIFEDRYADFSAQWQARLASARWRNLPPEPPKLDE
ncbi:MAG: tRNA guanosine(34) transglycosylase Tgt [Myxococcales bacterium]|nr:tRNA guanosine(34) transglycosylase Tgt [Myxococcales bacterium]